MNVFEGANFPKAITMAISTYLLVALLVGLTFSASILIFIIYRYVNYLRYRRKTNIPWILPLDNPLSGSVNKFLFSKERSVAENVIKLFKDNPQSDIFCVMIGPVPVVASTDPDLYYQVFIKDGSKHINRGYTGAPDEGLDNSLLNNYDNNWRRTRKALAPLMTHSNLIKRDVHKDIAEVTDKFISGLMGIIREKGTVFEDIVILFQNYTLGVVWAIGFDQHDEVDFTKERSDFVEALIQWMRMASLVFVKFFIYVPSLRFILFRIISIFNLSYFSRLAHDRTMHIVKNVMQETQLPTTRKKFVHHMVDLYIKKKINKVELTGNSLFFTLAGFDTSATTLTALIWYLAKYEPKQEKLRLDLIKYGQESQYLDWCLKETMRLSPPSNTGRTIEEDFEWNGYKILKGMVLFLIPHFLHMNEKYWGPDYDQFKPERFEDTRHHHPAQFVPFGLGIRNCLGYHLANLQIKILATKFLLQFRVSCTENTPKELPASSGKDNLLFGNTLKHGISLRIEPIVY